MARFKSAAGLKREIERCKKRMAVERDKLRDLIDEAEALNGNYEEAIDDMSRAADTVSQYV